MEEKEVNLYYSEQFDLTMRSYRNALVKVLNELQLVYQVDTLFKSKKTDYEGYLNLCVFVLNQINMVDKFIKKYSHIDSEVSDFTQHTFTPSPSGNEDRKEELCP